MVRAGGYELGEIARGCSVRAVACDHCASDSEVYSRLTEAVAPLSKSWDRLCKASKIAIKFNQDFPCSNLYAGQRRELVSDSVARAVLRLLRERTSAELLCVDASYMKLYSDGKLSETTQIGHILKEFDVRYVDCTVPPLSECVPPNGGAIFGRYHFAEELIQADERVSVAKMKNHAFMGITGCLKNLFGLMPAIHRPRTYFHHLVRMPYMLADIGGILDPALNIVDALVAQPGREWRTDDAAGVVVDTILAGDNAVSTDACMAWLMGHDPEADWHVDPFLRDRNSLQVAREHGFGTNRLDEIDFETDARRQEPGVFYCESTDPIQTIVDWRRSMCMQALHYRDNPEEFEAYHGQFILLQRGKVIWNSPVGLAHLSRRLLAGNFKRDSLFLKFVDPDEVENEHFEVYENALRRIEEI